jgi:peptidoglycan/LPS O-acetylase OafA/YrhL
MFIPPAWSLGVELSFYLLAPWILRRKTSVIIGAFVSSLLLRYALWQIGLRDDPWSYRFFPAELGMFLFGALSYRLIYRKIRNQQLVLGWKIFALGIYPAIVLYPVYDHSKGLFFTPTQILFYLYVGVSVPILFRMTGHHPTDRRLGELSYPLYLCHYLLVSIVGRFSGYLMGGAFVRASLVLIASVFVAYLVTVFFDTPIDRFRQRMVDENRRLHDECCSNARGTSVVGCQGG